MAGQQASCPTCHGIVQIAADAFQAAAPAAAALPADQPAPAAVMVGTPSSNQLSCPVCAGIFQVAPEMRGQEVLCPLCQARVTVPALESNPQSVEVRPALTPAEAARIPSAPVSPFDPPKLQGAPKQESKSTPDPVGSKPASGIEAYAPPTLPTSPAIPSAAPSEPAEPTQKAPSPFDPPTLPVREEKESPVAAPTNPAIFNPAKVVEQPRKLPPRPGSAEAAKEATAEPKQSAPTPETPAPVPAVPARPEETPSPQTPIESKSSVPPQSPVLPQSPTHPHSPFQPQSPADPQAPVKRPGPAPTQPLVDPQAPVQRSQPSTPQTLPDPQAPVPSPSAPDPQAPVQSDAQPQQDSAGLVAVAAEPTDSSPIVDPETGEPIVIHDAPTVIRQGDQIIELRRLTPEEKARRRLIKNIFVVALCAAILAGYMTWALMFR